MHLCTTLSLIALCSAVFSTAQAARCDATGSSLNSAKKAFSQECKGESRKDCDPVSGNQWMCANYTLDNQNFTANPKSNSTNSNSKKQCEVKRSSLDAVKKAFSQECMGFKRKDCDPVAGQWMCASYDIGNTNQRQERSNSNSSGSNSNGNTSALGGIKLDRTLDKDDQTPGGKKIYKAKNRPSNHKVHRTGVARYTYNGKNTEAFQVHATLGFRAGSSSTSRAEGYFSYANGTKDKTFLANYQLFDSENVSIFQQKDNTSSGPSIRISVIQGTDILVHTGKSRHNIAKIKDMQIFALEVNDLGNKSRITIRDLNGKKLGGITLDNTRNGVKGNKQFRYGAYTQKGEKANVSVIVQNARVK